jgi:uncharacterized protein YoaH (UPF0181 family)
MAWLFKILFGLVYLVIILKGPMKSVQPMQCGICKAFHLETDGPCPACQSHRIHQLAADGCNSAAALRQVAQRLRMKAEEMEREASALESNTSTANASTESVTTARSVTSDSPAADPGYSGLTRRSA